MGRTCVWAFLVVGAVIAATPAQAGEIQGRVYEGDQNYIWEPNVDAGPRADTTVMVIRVDPGAPPYSNVTQTNGEGLYSFEGLPPGGRYRVSLPFMDPFTIVQSVDVEDPANPEPIPELPDGIVPSEGDPADIDIVTTGSSAPRFSFDPEIGDNVVFAGALVKANPSLSEQGRMCRFEAVTQNRQLVWGQDDDFFDEDGNFLFSYNLPPMSPLEYTLTPIDPPGAPVTLLSGNLPAVPADLGVGMAGFVDSPLQLNAAGQSVFQVTLDPNQPALEGFGVVTPMPIEITYDPNADGSGPEVSDPDAIFVVRPIRDLTGRVFKDRLVNGTYEEGIDEPVPQASVFLYDLRPRGELEDGRPNPDPELVATVETDEQGNYVFPDTFIGLYRIDVVFLETDPDDPFVFEFFEDQRTIVHTDNPPSGAVDFPFEVLDTEPPVIECPDDITVVADGPDGALVEFDQPSATDNVDPFVLVLCLPDPFPTDPEGRFPIGTTTMTCTASDSAGNTATCSFTIEVLPPPAPPQVEDETAPVVHCVVGRPTLRRNGRMRNVRLEVAALDDMDPDPQIQVDVYGDNGARARDADYDPATGRLRLRGKTRGRGWGRIYLVVVTATDAAGNQAKTCCSVVVPRYRWWFNRIVLQFVATQVQEYCDLLGRPPSWFRRLTE